MGWFDRLFDLFTWPTAEIDIRYKNGKVPKPASFPPPPPAPDRDLPENVFDDLIDATADEVKKARRPVIYKSMRNGYWHVEHPPQDQTEYEKYLFSRAKVWTSIQNKKIFCAKPYQTQQAEVQNKFRSRGISVPQKWR